MKKLKLNIMAIIGMMVAVGTVAFTTPEKKIVYNAQAETWIYQLDSMDPLDLNDASNYVRAESNVTCNGSNIVCTIEDIPSTANPDEPQLSHGDVSQEPVGYQISKKGF